MWKQSVETISGILWKCSVQVSHFEKHLGSRFEFSPQTENFRIHNCCSKCTMVNFLFSIVLVCQLIGSWHLLRHIAQHKAANSNHLLGSCKIVPGFRSRVVAFGVRYFGEACRMWFVLCVVWVCMCEGFYGCVLPSTKFIVIDGFLPIVNHRVEIC